MRIDNFVRLLVMFDLPTETKENKRNYRKFVKLLTNDGFIRIQYSIYAKLCINSNSAITYGKRLLTESPSDGDVRFMVISENQYQSIVNVNDSYSLQEKITTSSRMIMIGEMNNEVSGG